MRDVLYSLIRILSDHRKLLRLSCLYRTLTRTEGIWDYQIKGIDAGNCRFVAVSGIRGAIGA